jgi:hypothetical protein
MNGFHFDALFDWNWLLLLDRFFFRFFIRCNFDIIILNCGGVVELLWGPIHSWELDTAYEATAPVSEDKVLRLIFAKFVDSIDEGVGHWHGIPTAPHNFLHGAQAHKLVPAL